MIKGRRWRISDPAIPEPLRQALVNELMAARRAVAAGNRREDEEAIGRARARVRDAKAALGERGPPWWLDRDEEACRLRAIAATRALLRARDGMTTSPPSVAELARIVDGSGWRRRLALVRRVLFELDAAREIDVRQRDRRVGPSARGRLAIRYGPDFPALPGE